MDKEISFTLLAVKTEQYATFEENLLEGIGISLGTGLEFKLNIDKKQIGVFATFSFEQDKKVFLKLQVSCHFGVKPESWEENITDTSIVLSKRFLAHISMLTVGTARGILHAKSDGTVFNKFCLPLINVTDLITEDAVFPLK